ncbi:MAG TPA: hypothetical protein VE088_02125 [Gaiellaceae bacterium]|jgi:hypothetical protein|nr:hypothetical protein [Gaiellaceae bacterium]
MRRYGLYDTSRGLTTALFAGIAGLALWGATQIGTQTPGRFWVAMVIVAAGGFVFALSHHVGSWTKGLRLRLSPGTFLLGFLPVLVAVGWILLASQPVGGWERGTIHSWSTSIGILGAVHDIGLWRGVLAFGFGLVLAFCFDAVPATVIEPAPAYGTVGPAETPRSRDEPLTAERHHAGGAVER